MSIKSLKGAISFLSGVLWALLVISAVTIFTTFLKTSFLDALFFTLMSLIFWLFLIILVELANIQIEKLEELKKQTKLLEKLANNDSVQNN